MPVFTALGNSTRLATVAAAQRGYLDQLQLKRKKHDH
jgi:hypothetical protein